MALADLGVTGATILNPLYTLWNSFVSILPGLLAAILILILGYAVAYIIAYGVKRLLERIGLDRQIEKTALTRAIGHTSVSSIVAEITKWYIFIIFLQVAAAVLQLGTLSNLLNSFVLWLPNVIAAVVILFAGVAFAYYVEIKMREYSKMRGIRFAASIVKTVILILVLIIALKQIGIEVSILENVFLIVIGAIAIGVALALGIGLGLGLRESAKKIIEDLRKNF